MSFRLALLLAGLAASGTTQVQLTNGSGGGERQPVMNANGTVVAYFGMVGGVREVFTVATTGGAPVRRTTNADALLGGTTVFDAWPSLSISDDGNRIAYWNAAGVHVLDIAANSDTVVAPANLLPYPQISGDGTRVVYQHPVNGDHEVFVVSASGGTPAQITTTSGVGRRLPHIRGDRVVFQKTVAGFEEVFLHDLASSNTTGPLSTTSGRGNRYARLTHDAAVIVYEALTNPGAIKEVFARDIAAATTRQVSSNSLRGDRLAAPTEDGEAFYEKSVTNREIHQIDLATSTGTVLTSNTRAGYRRISVDRHGTLAVYQNEANGTTEVFLRILCWAPTLSHYGQHGTPSTGVLQESDDVERCTFILGLDTSLPGGTAAVLLIGVAQTNVPLPNAPGNFLYTNPVVTLSATLNGAGDVAIPVNSPLFRSASSAFAQWALLDPPANALGVVSSRGIRIDFR